MADKPVYRRSYGYLQGHKPTTDRAGTTRPGDAQAKHPRQKPKGLPRCLVLLFFPVRLAYWLCRLCWHLFQRRPRLSRQTTRRLRKKLIFTAVFLGTGLSLAILGYGVIIGRNLPDPDRLTDRQVAESTKIYDRTGEVLLYEIFADQKRTLVPLNRVPKRLIQAVIATEDTKFYEHRGLRPLSIARAVIYGIFTNKRITGASTLTQQLVKNAILTNERSLDRKIKEAFLSLRLEQKYSKEQILQIYFNEIPYGSTNYGIQSAAQSYFGKDVSTLDLQEIATLAGLPKAPSYYLGNPEALKQRRDFVLQRMFEEGYIEETEKTDAQANSLTLKRNISNIKAPHFVLYVREQLIAMYGEHLVDTGGLAVITSLDWKKQELAEKMVEETADKTLAEAGANNLALLAMHPKTGEILVLVGSKDFYDNNIDGQFNVAIQGLRQPGSSFKPIIYAAAFEKGYTPDTVLFDVVTNFAVSGRPYQPLNFDLQERGPVTMRQAIQGSLNIPAVKTLYLVGEKQGVTFAERLGYTTLSNGDFGLSLVLGGGEVKLLDHVTAYSVLANGGERVNPASILKVTDRRGEVLLARRPERAERVLDQGVAATISQVLSDDAARSYVFGAGGVLTLPDRPVAAKTGTTNGYVDAWTIGYTPSLVTGVWAGNTDNSPMKGGFGGSKVAATFWNAFMRQALAGTPVESFPAAPGNDSTKPALRGSEGGSVTLLVDRVTGKLATSSTPPNYIVEKTYSQAHSLLHYVNKDDPRGPAPTNPTDDPQYVIWEEAIKNWIRRQKEKNPDWQIVFDEPPTEFDSVHSLELVPTLEIIYPAPSSTIFSRQIDTDIRVSAPRGVARVAYKLDEQGVGLSREHPFNLHYFAKSLAPGDHVLTVIVFDDVGNTLEESVPFTFDPQHEPAGVFWTSAGQTVTLADFPRMFTLSAHKSDEIKTVSILVEKNGERSIAQIFSDVSDKLQFIWEKVNEKGEYVLIAEIEKNDGERKETDRIKVMVD